MPASLLRQFLAHYSPSTLLFKVLLEKGKGENLIPQGSNSKMAAYAS